VALSTEEDFEALRDAIVSHAQAMGHFDRVQEWEPKSAPGTGLTCSIFFNRMGPVQSSGLNSTSAVVEFYARTMMSMLSEPQEKTDLVMAAAALELTRRISADFTLDGLVRNVILLPGSPDGEPLRTEAGYVNIDGKMQRALMTYVPCVVNDVWSQSP
jgi:hypothetical protein